MNILEADSIIQSFGLRKILTDVYIKCCTGEIIGILGRNGCGKTTLLKIIFGKLNAYNKCIRFNNEIIKYPYKQKNLITYLPEHHFLPKGIKINKIINSFLDKDRASEVSEDKMIQNHLQKKPNELSGGELKYLEVILILNSNSKFVLLDEPFTGIAPIYEEKIIELIKEYKTSKGIIITDHYYRNVIDISDKIYLIHDGGCRLIKKIEELKFYGYLPESNIYKNKKS